MSEQRGNYKCPNCSSTDIFLVQGTDGTYQCEDCGRKTHEKIEAMREELEALEAEDTAASEVATLLLGDDDD